MSLDQGFRKAPHPLNPTITKSGCISIDNIYQQNLANHLFMGRLKIKF